MDVALRGAVSIARRLQDPLAELVKIDPKSIGVGQYQHDLPESALSRSLDAVVEDCVNAVGVDVNTASAPLLRRVSGITESLAAQIVAHRDANGPFRTRTALADVPRLGPKAFEQCAGFLRIRGGDDPLDVSGVHPEAYPVVRRILARAKTDIGSLIGNAPKLKSLPPKEFVDERFGLPTVTDILAELEKPGRDPRPAFRTATFAEGVHKLSDLRPGMVLEGQVTNVAAFGAFVDVGVHQDGLVHVSAMSATFVSDPREVVKSGDVVRVKVLEVDEARKRISLTLRLDDDAKRPSPSAGPAATGRSGAPARRPTQGADRGGDRDRREPRPPDAGRPRRPRTAPWPTRCAARDSPGSSRDPFAPMMGDADRRRTHGQEQHQRCGAPKSTSKSPQARQGAQGDLRGRAAAACRSSSSRCRSGSRRPARVWSSCSRDATPRARAARSSGWRSTSTPASAASSPCPRPPSGSARSGTSSATSSTSPPRARSCCSTAVGTTARASSA